jgi:tetratricopeptide (TPR) repeat protein
LNDNDVAGAEAMLAPLADETRFQPQEMAFYSFVQARLLLRKEEYDAARRSLEIALQMAPDYEPAKEMLARLELMSEMRTNWDSFMERQHDRDQAKRSRQQAKLTTAEPGLAEALPLYSKDVLVTMGRIVIRSGSWATYKKAELIELLIKELTDPDNLKRIVAKLSDREQEALRQVMAGGGVMVWAEFEQRYDNDLKESPYWQYHTPESVMGRLRLHSLLVEAVVAGQLLIVAPAELRQMLANILDSGATE